MKLEMGESLLYSWLKHVKNCQIVQTNWKASQNWDLSNENKLKQIKVAISKYFEKYHDNVLRKFRVSYPIAELDVTLHLKLSQMTSLKP